ncbi:MAG: ATP-binding protein [Desulfobacteraceae bacterium]|nr:MAG: ATP-binding protein [Desulfobacteraceae bacterium]
MSYFADSAWKSIDKKIAKTKLQSDIAVGKKLLVMVPALSEGATLDLATTLASRCAADNTVDLTLKIAQVVTASWSSSGFNNAKDQRWLDERGNLAYYRSNLPLVPGKVSLVVLCGADRVTDAGSLDDFYRCDLETVWQIEMRGSFQSWTRVKLQSIGLAYDQPSELREFDRLMKPLLEQGRADLLQISAWFEALDLNAASTIREAQRIMLGRYQAFQLPKFSKFQLGRTRVSLGPYIEKAHAFFTYALFLDNKERDKADKAIRQILSCIDRREDTGLPLDDEDVRGPYETREAFLEGLNNYIQTEDHDDRERLRQCDFVTIIDKILKFRKKGEKKDPDPFRKLSGSPVEMVLYSLWQTFRDFKRDKRFNNAELQRVEIACDHFKHDYESAADVSDATIDRTDSARQYLMRLLGGVDGLVAARVEVSGADVQNVPVACRLASEEVACSYSKTAEPRLEFSVYFFHDADDNPYRRKFAWRLPEIQTYRLSEGLLHWAKDALEEDHGVWKLPVFHLPYYEELLRATDDEETRRVMLHCIRDAHQDDAKWTNLLGREWLASGDILLPHLKRLADKYTRFISAAYISGLHVALFGDEWTQLRQAYTAACESVVDDGSTSVSQMLAMLIRTFLVVQRRSAEFGVAWGTEPYERSAVATVLHPAVLEMLEAKIVFLFSCFNAAVASEQRRDDRSKAFAEKIWNGYVDLASIQSPIAGLLYNTDLNLDTNIRGQELIHRIGSPEQSEATLSTRLLLRYESVNEEEEVTDTEMFRESRESKLLFRLMTDYFRLHPHARDGLAIAVYRNQDIQTVIAAVHQYLNKLADEKDRRYYALSPERQKPYAIGVTIFTESGDDVDVARWIDQWRERWEAAETEGKFQAYRRCRFAVAHRIVQTTQLLSFQRLINDNLEADIVVLYDFIGAGQGGNRFTEVTPFDITTRTLKFPILEKSCCAVRHPTDSYKRSRVMSNLQFNMGMLHTQIMHRLKNQGVQPGREFVVLGIGDFAPWRGVIDALHAKAEWVICIDPNMDDRLIKIPAGENRREREIIGFGSGVGSHGEANYTISTEQFSLADIHVRLAASIQEVYAACNWSGDDCEAAAKSVLHEARELSGLSLVRATGVGHYIRDFMAYSLTRKILREKRKVLCDNLVSLDAYRHWFDLSDNERRPDLMWLTAWLDENKRVCISIRLIECKLAQQSEEHLIKARAQINNGLRVLVPAFAPRNKNDGALGEDIRPDQRYWWLQLHRLIASKAEIENREQFEVLSALERLAEGDYEIEWGAAVFAFWSDSDAAFPTRIGSWTVGEADELKTDIYVMGNEFVRRLALNGTGFPVTWREWEDLASTGHGNVCDGLEDIELPPGDDDDEDSPLWADQDDGEKSEDFEPSEQGLEKEAPQVEIQETELSHISPDSEFQPVATDLIPDQTSALDEPRAFLPIITEPEKDFIAEFQTFPKRILLGRTLSGGKPVYWEFGHPELANRHMLVFGTSGMGKTYAIQCLLSEFGRVGQNSLIIDYTDGFIPSKLEKATATCLKPKQHFIQQAPLPIRPFKVQVSHEAGMEFPDSPITIGKRVASIFKSVYELGNQQFPILIDAISEGVERFGDNFSLNRLLEILQTYIEDDIHGTATVRTTVSKLKPFIQSNPFSDDVNGIGWQELFSDVDCRCHVFQFFKVDKHSARALIEFVLWDLYAFVSSHGNENTPRVVVLDEVQNLDLGPDAPVAKYLTEGRKHGLAMITATQTVKGVGGVNDARVSRFFQAEQKLFFKPTENEMREHAQLLHNAISNVSVQDWATRLASLQKGECWSLGRSLNEATGKLVFQAQRIRITSLEERGFNA